MCGNINGMESLGEILGALESFLWSKEWWARGPVGQFGALSSFFEVRLALLPARSLVQYVFAVWATEGGKVARLGSQIGKLGGTRKGGNNACLLSARESGLAGQQKV